jgi:hypothetical protein
LPARRDAATDPAPATPSDGPADAPPKGGLDVPVVQPDVADAVTADLADAPPMGADVPRTDASDLARTDAGDANVIVVLLDGGNERSGTDAVVDQGSPDDRGGVLEVGGDLKVDTADGRVDTAPALDSLAPDVRGDGGPDRSGQCNDLTPEGPLHEMVGVSGAPPTPVGGTIEDGVYYETEARSFGATSGSVPAGTQRRMTMVIAGSLMQAAFSTSLGGEVQTQTHQMMMPPDGDPTSLPVKQLCPGSSPAAEYTFHYSFVGTGPGATFTVIYPTTSLSGAALTSVLTLVKQ